MTVKSLSSIESTLREEFLPLNGGNIRYLAGGTGSPLVLIHGLLGYSFCFRFNLPILAQHASVYAIDLPGAGFSEYPPPVSGSLRSLAATLLEFLNTLGLRRPVLLGSSHGGAVALMAASLAKEQHIELGPMILAAPVNPWSRNGARLARLAGSRAASLALRCASPMMAPLHGYFLRRMYGDPKEVRDEAIAGYSRALRRKGAMAHLLGRVKRWQQEVESLASVLENIQDLPMLLIWGERDRAVDPASAQELLRRLPRAELAVIPEAGHLPFEETPEEFNRLALNFLARHAEAHL